MSLILFSSASSSIFSPRVEGGTEQYSNYPLLLTSPLNPVRFQQHVPYGRR